MSTSQTRAPNELDEYERNRQQFTAAQVGPYQNQWVAFSPDGKRIIAAALTLLELDRRLVGLGENPEQVGLEFLIADECSLGGAGSSG